MAKLIYFIRHGLAEHNAALEKVELTAEDVLREYAGGYHDSRLAPFGMEEAAAVGRAMGKLSPAPQVVVTSPLSRTTATAVKAFGGSAPIVACELWRERSGRWPCERRRTRGVLAADFPTVDYSEIPTEEDALWGEQRETGQDASLRAAAAIRYLLARPEAVIAVVSHAGFLGQSVFNKKNVAISGMPVEMQVPFTNGEIRCVEARPEAGGQAASLTWKWSMPNEATRDPAERARAHELQFKNMRHLNQIFATPRGEELLRELRSKFPKLFEADGGLAKTTSRL